MSHSLYVPSELAGTSIMGDIQAAVGARCDILAVGAAKLLASSPDPKAWTDTGLEGILMFTYYEKEDRHSFELVDPQSLVTLFENSRRCTIHWSLSLIHI